ncbi:Prenylcysteine lyase-domain-containing protein, partial [Endogone sp. FLAS-F59071]
VRNLVLSTIDRLSYAYSHDISPSFTNIKNFTNFLNFGEETGRTARRYFITDSRIETKYIEQIVQSATRVNYAQDIDTIHALGALVSMAAQGAKSVKGGNFQIFQKFIEEAGAELRLKTKVDGIKKVVDKTGKKVSVAADIIANPPAFQTVHVTFISGKRDPTYFGIDDLSKAPNMVITTADGSLFPEHRQPFTTFAEHHLHNETGESIVKMFSAVEVPDTLLDALFTTRSWTRRHVWQAYPVLTPVWPPVVLDEEHEGEGDGGVFYVNAFESFISTMETETLASKNVVRLLHKQWCEDCEPFGDGWTAEDAAPVPNNATKSLDGIRPVANYLCSQIGSINHRVWGVIFAKKNVCFVWWRGCFVVC